MFNSLYLDVAIALIMVFVLLSVVASFISEWIANMLQLRGKALRDAVLKMFDGKNGSFGISVLEHPLVQNGSLKEHLPSYLEPAIFSGAVVDALLSNPPAASGAAGAPAAVPDVATAIASLKDADTKKALGALWRRAANDMKAFDTELENWFNATMSRLSGVYKRKNQIILGLLGLAIAISMNVDTIYIANKFYQVSGLRDAAVAEGKVISASGTASMTATDAWNTLTNLHVPMGWGNSSITNPACCDYCGWSMRVAGWLLTAVAISFGGPFWFDLLGRVTNLRGAGTKPEKKE